MIQTFGKAPRWFSCVSACFVIATAVATSCGAQDKNPNQTAGVEDTKMGAYRALAQLSFQAFQKGDNVTAATLARILERTWDKGEADFEKSNPDLRDKIDRAMDAFIKPIMAYANKRPDPIQAQAAYNDYLDKLKQGDQ
jgi:hypothetical protein